MDKVNNVRSASHVGSSLSPIETAILILIGAFILMRIMRKLLDLITDKDSDTTNNRVHERSSSTSTSSTGGDENATDKDSDTTNNRVHERSSNPRTMTNRRDRVLKLFSKGDVVRNISDKEHPERAYVVVDYDSSSNLCRMKDGYDEPHEAYAHNLAKMKTAPEGFPEIYSRYYLLTDNIELLNHNTGGYDLIRKGDRQNIYDIKDADFVGGFHRYRIPKKMLKKC